MILPHEVTGNIDDEDDILLLAASWEDRCLGLASKLKGYSCKYVILTAYDGVSEKREANLQKLRKLLGPVGKLHEIQARHSDPLENVRDTIQLIKELKLDRPVRMSIDATTFTRKHLLQLLQGLDMSGMLLDSRIFHTEPLDYHTQNNEPIAEGISSIKTIETFGGEIMPSKDSLLILFLGYEGRRALALLENLEPNRAIVVMGDPPYRESWKGRAEAQNRYLLSCLPASHIYSSHSLVPSSTEDLMARLAEDGEFSMSKYNYFVGPLGTKAQIVGLYRYWRYRRATFTIVYARPGRYKEEQADFPPGRTWLIDDTSTWAPVDC